MTYKSFLDLDYIGGENITIKVVNDGYNNYCTSFEKNIKENQNLDKIHSLYHHLNDFIPLYNRKMLYYIYYIFTYTENPFAFLEKNIKETDMRTSNSITLALKELYRGLHYETK